MSMRCWCCICCIMPTRFLHCSRLFLGDIVPVVSCLPRFFTCKCHKIDDFVPVVSCLRVSPLAPVITLVMFYMCCICTYCILSARFHHFLMSLLWWCCTCCILFATCIYCWFTPPLFHPTHQSHAGLILLMCKRFVLKNREMLCSHGRYIVYYVWCTEYPRILSIIQHRLIYYSAGWNLDRPSLWI